MGFFDSFLGSNYRESFFKNNPSVDGFYICKMCGKRLEQGNSDLTIDHIVPQKYGGTNSTLNLQVLCRSCNSKKGKKIDTMTFKYAGDALMREIKNTFS